MPKIFKEKHIAVRFTIPVSMHEELKQRFNANGERMMSRVVRLALRRLLSENQETSFIFEE